MASLVWNPLLLAIPLWMKIERAAALAEPEICYVLDGLLFMYGIVLTVLYCRIKSSTSSSPLVPVTQGDFVDLPPSEPILSLADEETVLPCRYQPSENVVVQVTWYKGKPEGTKEQIITAHHMNGQTAFGTWSRRVRFKSSDPTADSSLVILTTEVSDEGEYFCRISTFPSGNFDREMSLIVWTVPISSLDPVIMVEGQTFRLAASCRSVARPLPHLSWDTDLNGLSVNRTSDNGAVSTQYSLHPLRSMNGKKLDCVVRHPTLSGPRRLRNNLVVHFPPHAEVSGYNADWSWLSAGTADLPSQVGGEEEEEEEGGPYDYLGRPVLHNSSRRGRERPLDIEEESRLRVETYVRNSTMSMDLHKKYSYIRKTRPDGNCFYRAFGFAHLESLLDDSKELQKFKAVAAKSKLDLVNEGFTEFTIEDFHNT
ncbi:unnamed protein product, partial [Lampetra planeri]